MSGRRIGGLNGRTIALHFGVLVGLTLLAVMAWSRVWVTGHPTSTISCACGDPSQELWLFAWVPHALSHGLNPLSTNLLDAGQGGVNIMWDANNLFGSLLLSPVTVLFGPVASFNVAALMGPVLSGWCFFLAVRKVTQFVPGQVAGALLYGFSPFIVWNSPYGHTNLTWLFFPPLAFMLLYDLCSKPHRRPAAIGRWFGALVVVQFFVGTEVLVISAIGIVIGGLCASAISLRAAWALRRRIGIAALWTAGISGCLLAYPAWFAVYGPRHIVGSPWPSLHLSTHGSPAATILSSGASLHAGNVLNQVFGYYGAAGPPLLYLGIGLVVFLAVSSLVWYRDRLAWVMVALGGVATLLSLGTVLVTIGLVNQAVPTDRAPWWLLWRQFVRLPLIRYIEPSRFAVLVEFAAAVLVVIAADRWWQARTRVGGAWASSARLRSRPILWGTLITVAAAAALWPVGTAYTLPYVVHQDPAPAWFTTVAPHLAPGTRVLVLPTDFATVTNVMSWQAEEGLPFALEGGYAVAPGPNSVLLYSLADRGAAGVLDQLSSGRHLVPTARRAAIVRAALARWGVGAVVMIPRGPDPDYSATFLTAVLSRPPLRVDGVLTWSPPW